VSEKINWTIKVIEGPLKGSTFPMSPGTSLGRFKAEINLEDPKASNIHAKIEETASGALILKDLNSTNGLKFKGRKVKEVILASGIQVRLGQTLLEFLSQTELVESPVDGHGQHILSFLKAAKAELKKNALIDVTPLAKILKFEFIKGLQVETVWHVGYAPRDFGPASGEFPLLESRLEGVCFSLVCEDNQAFLLVHDQANVSINGQKTKKHLLNDGDLITVGSAIIHVSSISD
jgi:hypothetical protein